MKRKLINSFIILTTTTLMSKLFNITNRIILSRLLLKESMTLYILILPTFSLCITLAQFSVPSAVFRLVSHPKYRNKKVMITSLLICIITCFIIVITLVFFSKAIATHLLKQNNAYIPLLCLVPLIPLITLTGILKNYYLGKENVIVLTMSQLYEEISRIVFTVIFLILFQTKSVSFQVSIAILSMSIGEASSFFYLIKKLKNETRLSFPIVLKDNFIIKDILNIALPLTGSRIIHSVYNFLEPIILIRFLSYYHVETSLIHNEYAIINGYVISLLFTPTFFNNVILRLLIPTLNKDLAIKNQKQFQKHIIISALCCFFISLPFTLFFYFHGDFCLFIMYNTKKGYEYLKYMSIPFILFYLQTPLSATLQVLNKNKELFFMSIYEVIIETLFLFILMPTYHVASVAIVMLIGLFSTLVISLYFVYRFAFVSHSW